MSTLEVLQSSPPQWKSLLSSIGGIDPPDLDLITFDLDNHIPRLPHQIAFLIQVIINSKNIHCIVIDEGASFASCSLLVGRPSVP